MSEAQHNDGVTRRDLIKKGALLGGTVMWVTPAVQTVGMSRALAQTPSDTCIEQWAAEVISFDQGTTKIGGVIPAGRSNPAAALGAPDGPSEGTFVSLGFKSGSETGGSITIKFASPAYIATGSDVLIVETTFNAETYPEETAHVQVSMDGTTFHNVGTASNKSNPSTLDLSGVPVTYIQYVKLTDTTDPAIHTDNAADGFDVDAIGIACP